MKNSVTADKQKKRIRLVISSVVLVLAIIVGACFVYLGDYYRADSLAIQAFELSDFVKKQTLDNGNTAFVPENAKAGFIFYPGGKVEDAAYIPLMQKLSENGVLCVLCKMPFNLAVFDIDAAEGIQEQFCEIENWYIGGHSLGGSMAAAYLGDHENEYEGLILLGSYSTEELSHTDLQILSIYGSEDQVLNQEKYAANKNNLPEGFTELVIEGGCHAYFGTYGPQKGDGKASITNEEQIEITAEFIAEQIFGE